MFKALIHSLLLSGVFSAVPALATQLLLSSLDGETVIIDLQDRETFKLAHSRPLHAKSAVEFETKPRTWSGSYKKQGEQIVLWADTRELGRIQAWDSSGQIQAQLYLFDTQKAKTFRGLMFR